MNKKIKEYIEAEDVLQKAKDAFSIFKKEMIEEIHKCLLITECVDYSKYSLEYMVIEEENNFVHLDYENYDNPFYEVEFIEARISCDLLFNEDELNKIKAIRASEKEEEKLEGEREAKKQQDIADSLERKEYEKLKKKFE